jgi:hypothetical protein
MTHTMTDPDPTPPITPAQAIDLSIIFTPKLRAWLYVIGFLVGAVAAGIQVTHPAVWLTVIPIAVSALMNLLATVNTVPLVQAAAGKAQP